MEGVTTPVYIEDFKKALHEPAGVIALLARIVGDCRMLRNRPSWGIGGLPS